MLVVQLTKGYKKLVFAELWSNPEFSMQIEEVSITARPYFNMHKILFETNIVYDPIWTWSGT